MDCCLISPRAQQWLENGRSPRILHLFEEVCNLVDAQGQVLSLVSPAIGPGPFTLVVEGNFTAALRLNQSVRIDPSVGRLAVGPLQLNTQSAATWQPRPFWPQLQKLACSQPPLLPPEIYAPLRQVLQGFQTADTSQIQAGAAGLAGRGPGLTPAGDDVLTGVLYALWVWRPRRDWLAAIVETAVPRTTTLSAAFLQAAAAGEAVWQWHDLVNGRVGALDQILSIGHTSGADAWTGFTHAASRLSLAATINAHRKPDAC